ncbi:S8 family peptidase [Candidatus Uabimicrobium amorphum]|uniref:Subtilisin E n=1 Tax=Uabimicrobium amorphum TaxID=2596890 RepID=A0A5S9F227_UABAM|nr:S8 family peptidase [Candidatus Uabimicrobium amorphum]BBM83225.1 subtilisin E [Candidatus Uabimicrobium amorphum]
MTKFVILLTIAITFSCSFAGILGPDLQKAMQGDESEFAVMISFTEDVKVGDIMEYYSGMSKEEIFDILKNECEQKQTFIKDLCQRMQLEGYVKDIKVFWLANAVSLTAKREAIEELVMQPEVHLISLDAIQSMIQPFGSLDSAQVPWGLEYIKSREVNAKGFTGQGVTVAVVDTGLDTDHPAFSPQQIRTDLCKSFVPGEPTVEDGNGHGTHCAGTVASQLYGVAPGASLIGVKVLSATGSGSWTAVMEGVQYSALHADVISMSLGGRANPNGNVVEDAVENAIDNGIVVVIAAGNEGPFMQTIGTPGCVKKAITVGAIDNKGELAYFSSRGVSVYLDPKPDMVAPGVDVLSAWKNGGTNTISGTSMATPHVAGLVALMLSKAKGMKPQGVKNILMATTNGTKKENWYGEGTVQCDLAMSKVGTDLGTLEVISERNQNSSTVKIEAVTDSNGKLSVIKTMPANRRALVQRVFCNARYTNFQLSVNGKNGWEKGVGEVEPRTNYDLGQQIVTEKGEVTFKVEAENGPKNSKVKIMISCRHNKLPAEVAPAPQQRVAALARSRTIFFSGRTDREGNLNITQDIVLNSNRLILDMQCNAAYDEYQVTINGEAVWEKPVAELDARTFYPIQKSVNSGSITIKVEGKNGPKNNAKVKFWFRSQ